MAIPGDPNAIAVGFEADGGSLDHLQVAITDAISDGFAKGFSTFGQEFSKNANFTKTLNQIGKAISDNFDPSKFKGMLKGIEGLNTQFAELFSVLKQVGAETSNINQVIRSTGSIARQEAIRLRTAEQQAAKAASNEREAALKQKTVATQTQGQKELAVVQAQAAERLQIQRAELDAEGRAQKQAAELSIVAAKASAKTRVAITRGLVEAIVALEKGLGTAIQGIARTATSAISRTFSGLSGALKSVFTRSNADITEGLNSSLNRRESIMRSSFRQQETIVRESVTRQERQLNELRTISSRGVAGAVTGRGIGFGIGGLVAGIGVGRILAQGFKDATNLTEQLNKNKVLFGEFTQGVVDFSKTSVNALGTTQAVALESIGTFGNLFRALGFAEAPAAQLSVQMTQLATDLSSFNNVPVEDAFLAIRSGLVGEQEPLRKFGVNLNEATLKAKALELGLFSGKGTLSAYAKAQAALALIMEQTTLAQGDFARTANEGANAQRRASAAIQQVASDIAGKLKPIVTTLANGLVPVLTTISDLITGNVTGALLLLRDGLKGAAAGLAAVIAVKGAVQVFQLLGLAIQFALTPLGLLLIAGTGLGALFNILMERSDTFREAISNLIIEIKSIGETVIRFVQPYLHELALFITNTLIPALEDAGTAIAEHIVDAMKAVARFVIDVAVPALVEFYRVVRDTVIPIAIRVGDVLIGAFNTAIDAVKRFASFVLPFLQPAVDGFIDLGRAIGAAFSGDFSKLLGGFASVGSGIAEVATRVGTNIFNALKPIGVEILDFFKNLFSVRNLQTAFGAILDVVEFIGRTIGSIATDPRVLKVVGTIAGVLALGAVQIGFRFLKGFVGGVVDHLDELADLGVDMLQAIAKGLADPRILTAVFAAIAFGPKLISLFRSLGKTSAQEFATGFRTSAGNAGGFAEGLFGGRAQTLQNNFFRNLKSNISSINAEQAVLQRQLGVFGSDTIVGRAPKQLEAARTELGKLKGAFTEAQVSGILFRDKVSSVGEGLATLGTGVAGALRGIPGSFRTMVADLKSVAAGQGTTIGAALGKGIAVGALAAVGGFAAGKASGGSAIGGITAILTAGFAGFSLSGGNPAVAGIAAGAAALGVAFSDSGEAAAKFRDQVKELSGALTNDLGAALADGTTKTVTFSDALAKAGEGQVLQKLIEQLGPQTIKVLNDIGVSASDVLASFAAGQDDVQGLVDRLGGLDPTTGKGKAAISLVNAFTALGTAIDQVNQKNLFSSSAVGQLAETDRETRRIAGALAATPDTSGLQGSIATVDTGMGIFKATIDATQTALTNLFNPPTAGGSFQAVIDQQILAVQGIGAQIAATQAAISEGTTSKIVGDAQIRTLTNQITSALGVAVAEGVDDGLIVDPATARVYTASILQASLAGITDPAIISAITDAYNTGISGVTPLIQTTDAAKSGEQISTAIQDYLDQHPIPTDLAPGSEAAQQYGQELATYFAAHPVSPNVNPNSAVAVEAAKTILSGIATQFGLSKSQMSAIGSALSQGIADGIDANRRAAVNAAQRLADAVIKTSRDAFAVASPSKVFMDIGLEIGKGLELGIKDGTSDVNDLLSNALDNAINGAVDRAQHGASAIQNALGTLFSNVTGSNALTGTGGRAGGLGAAQAAVTGAIQGFASNFDSVVGQALAAGGVNPNQRTAAQRAIAGSNFRSLDPNDVLGASNLGAFTQALDAISDLGQQLLAQGQTPGQVAGSLKAQVDKLVALASSLGFSFNDIVGLVDSFGLTDAALKRFVSSADSATASMTLAAASAKAQADAQGNVVGGALPRDPVIVQVYAPYGDPAAIGLASANAVAARWLGGIVKK